MASVHLVRIEPRGDRFRVWGRGVDATVASFSQAWRLSRFLLGPYWYR